MDFIAKHNAMQGARIASHFTGNAQSTNNLVEKSLSDELEKGKKANIGEIREWSDGKKYRKVVDGWVEVVSGEKRTKVEEGDVDKEDAKKLANEKKGGAEKTKGLAMFGDKHLFAGVRESHTTESLESKAKEILADSTISKPDKTVELFKQGLDIHEIVNTTGTPLSATIDYIKKAQKDGKLGDVKPGSSSTPKPVGEAKQEPEIDLSALFEPITLEERWNSYRSLANRVALKRSRAMIAYGSGGVGKTYTLLDPEDGVFARNKLRKGNIIAGAENDDAEDVNPTGEDSIVGFNPTTGERFLKKDKYDYITVTGKVSPVRMFELMQEHNNKIIVFDDCDSVLKSDDAVNVLKGALDTSGDGTISWEGKGNIETTFAGIKGGKAIMTTGKDPQPTGRYKLPKTFKFTGQVVFISNMKNSEIPQALKSRSDRIDLTMTKDETVDMVKKIAPFAKLKTPEGDLIHISPESRQNASDFMEKYISIITDQDLNMRTFLKIADTYQLAQESGQTETSAERTMLASLIERKI